MPEDRMSTPPPARPERGRIEACLHGQARRLAAPIFVGATLVILLILSARLTLQHSLPLPFWDEWEMVPQATGVSPVTPEWLWSPHEGERIPLPKLYYHLVLGKTFALRAAPFNLLSVFLLGGMAILAVVSVRAARGRTLWSDAFLPAIFLHGNHWATTTTPLGIILLLPAFLLCLCIFQILCHREGRERRTSMTVGVCLLGISLCGRVGLPAVLLLSPWLIGLELRGWRKGRRNARLVDGIPLALGIAALALLALRLAGPSGGGSRPPSPSAGASLVEAVRCLSVGIGHKSIDLWPLSGVAALALAGLTGVVLAGTLRRRPSDRARASGLFLSLLALCGSALLIGRDGAVRGEGMGFAFPYTSFCCLLPFVVYSSAEICAWPMVARGLRVLLPMTAWILLWPNYQEGVEMAKMRGDRGQAFVEDLRAGQTLHELGRLHFQAWHPDKDRFVSGLKMLRDARMGIFRGHPPPDLWRYKPDLWSVRMLEKGNPDCGGTIQLEEGLPGLVAHPISRAAWPIPGEARRVRFAFGIVKGAYTGPHKTDGVEFRLELETQEGGEEAFWSRYLDPLNVPADRGLQVAELEIPEGAAGASNLVFATLRGPKGNGLWDWAYWGEVEFVRR